MGELAIVGVVCEFASELMKLLLRIGIGESLLLGELMGVLGGGIIGWVFPDGFVVNG